MQTPPTYNNPPVIYFKYKQFSTKFIISTPGAYFQDILERAVALVAEQQLTCGNSCFYAPDTLQAIDPTVLVSSINLCNNSKENPLVFGKEKVVGMSFLGCFLVTVHFFLTLKEAPYPS